MFSFDFPSPVTVAFVGYWLAPTMVLAKGLGSFAPSWLKPQVERWLLALNLAVGGLGIAIWLVADARGNGEFLPTSAGPIDYLLGTSGLVLLIGTALAFDTLHRLHVPINIDLWLSRWAFLGALSGLLLWGMQSVLN